MDEKPSKIVGKDGVLWNIHMTDKMRDEIDKAIKSNPQIAVDMAKLEERIRNGSIEELIKKGEMVFDWGKFVPGPLKLTVSKDDLEGLRDGMSRYLDDIFAKHNEHLKPLRTAYQKDEIDPDAMVNAMADEMIDLVKSFKKFHDDTAKRVKEIEDEAMEEFQKIHGRGFYLEKEADKK